MIEIKAKHRVAIEQCGVIAEHRLSFAPLAKYREGANGVSEHSSEQAKFRRKTSQNNSLEAAELGSRLEQSSLRQELSRKVFGKFHNASEQRSETPPTTKQVGDRAESVVANYLEGEGHEIVARNWRTRFCEIDIISVNDETVYFTEVKYRKKADWGDGMSAITAKKQQQMRYAAEVFGAHFKQLANLNQRLAAASVAGEEFTLNEWLVL